MKTAVKHAVESELEQAIGRALRRIRCAKRLTQADIAAVFGISFQQYQKIENGRNRISASRLLKLSMVLDIPVDHFFVEARALLEDRKSTAL